MKADKMQLHRTVIVLFAAWVSCSVAQAQEVSTFVPYAGVSGYQEFSLGTDSWYLAFHGTQKHSMALVEAGWLARAAQLCHSVRKTYVVELKYIGERSLDTDPVAYDDVDSDMRFFRVASGGVVFIPIYTPSVVVGDIPLRTTPSKLAPIRCLASGSGLRDGKVAINTSEALRSARDAGLAVSE